MPPQLDTEEKVLPILHVLVWVTKLTQQRDLLLQYVVLELVKQGHPEPDAQICTLFVAM